MVPALICVALLGILLFGLGFAASRTRGRTGTASGNSGDPTDTLHKLVRAHGNTSEYAGMLAVLIEGRRPTTRNRWRGTARSKRSVVRFGGEPGCFSNRRWPVPRG